MVKRIIFIHLPKCGGTSVKQAFIRSCKDREDIEFISVGHMNISYFIKDYHEYLYKIRISRNTEKSTFNYFEDPDTLFLTVTRNPYRKFISSYFYELKHNEEFRNKTKDICDINELLRNIRQFYTLAFWRQSWFLERSEEVKNFKFFQLENLEPLLKFVKDEYNLELDIEKVNTTEESANSKLSIFNRESVKTLNRWYEQDFRKYGYFMINPAHVEE